MKFWEKKWDLFKYWLSEYFKHPVENIKQADPIVPGKLYRNYGHLIKAVPLTTEELDQIEHQRTMEKLGMREAEMLNMASKREITTEQLHHLADTWGTSCQFCGTYGVAPCPYYNRLDTGEPVCFCPPEGQEGNMPTRIKPYYKYALIRRAKVL